MRTEKREENIVHGYVLIKKKESWGILILTKDRVVVQVLTPNISVRNQTVLGFGYEKALFKHKIDGEELIPVFLEKLFKGYTKEQWKQAEFDLTEENRKSIEIKMRLHL